MSALNHPDCYTPAPWKRDGWNIVGSDNSIVAKIVPWDDAGCRHEDHANADLIAEVPSLLASCRELIQAMYDYEWCVDDAPTPRHREMMLRATEAVEKAAPRRDK